MQTTNVQQPRLNSKSAPVKWSKQWVSQDVIATGGKCYLFKWVTEETLKELTEKSDKPVPKPEPEPEPATEVLFLCSYEGCGKTFIDAGALRKHSLIHGEKQYICHYEGCTKKFLDNSKLKRHYLTHTGERNYVCPVEGCGKAFSLDFNLKSHMKTHSEENYHICPYQDCGKRYTHEYKLRNHIASYHEKSSIANAVKYTRPAEKLSKTPRTAGGAYGSASSNRPYACPYKGCEKAYIHEYKLRLHLRREHPDNMLDSNADNDMDEGSGQDAYAGKKISSKDLKQSTPRPSVKMPPAKVTRKAMTTSPANVTLSERPWQAREEVYRGEDSEETEDDDDNVEEGWKYAENNEDDDEDTDYED